MTSWLLAKIFYLLLLLIKHVVHILAIVLAIAAKTLLETVLPAAGRVVASVARYVGSVFVELIRDACGDLTATIVSSAFILAASVSIYLLWAASRVVVHTVRYIWDVIRRQDTDAVVSYVGIVGIVGTNIVNKVGSIGTSIANKAKSWLGTRLPRWKSALLSLWKGKTSLRASVSYHAQRPVISGPVGPVKTSRGPDFARSTTLTMIHAVDDCARLKLESKPRTTAATRGTRRISAGFPKEIISPTATPVVASSRVLAMTTIHAPSISTPIDTFQKVSVNTSTSTFALTATSTVSFQSNPSNFSQDENLPPDAGSQETIHDLDKTYLPKSRTMNVLQELRNSFPRPSLPVRSANSTSFSRPLNRRPSSSKATTPSPPTIPLASRHDTRHSSLPSVARSSPCSQSMSPPPPATEPSPFDITTAQPSEYWSGRFMTLNDKFMSENLDPDALSQQIMAHHRIAQPKKKPFHKQRSTHLSLSTTTSALASLPSTESRRSEDEDDRHRRIFARLGSLCITLEARQSLHDWQQQYARHHNKPHLLPRGRTMSDKTLMKRLFGGKEKKSARQSLSSGRNGIVTPIFGNGLPRRAWMYDPETRSHRVISFE
ncbi:hypothetical protein S7711_08181 [Stachybotrys chartarum IBT 7711]|uniref:Uncharacterized protein n=1 Tax=Stachybotrys chartarum (strain CBS 109288 / IBT 7711) TaxID=1280523 RepID=A0A084ANM2_STACB|nr:hypothetical protein S7711_08181 [Stachybotrys chartarum IBT 7711]